MWPSGVKHSFGGFCGSMFVVGAGLSTLETAADPFLRYVTTLFLFIPMIQNYFFINNTNSPSTVFVVLLATPKSVLISHKEFKPLDHLLLLFSLPVCSSLRPLTLTKV